MNFFNDNSCSHFKIHEEDNYRAYVRWAWNIYLSRDMKFLTMWHFDMNRLRRAHAASYKA